MSKRWGVWMRLAVVITGLWLVTAPIAGCVYEEGQWAKGNEVAFSACYADQAQPTEIMRTCGEEVLSRRFDAKPVFLSGLVPALIIAALAWFIALGLRATIRWILAGRNAA